MKKVLIIILAVLLAISGGLLCYGAINPSSKSDMGNKEAGDAPAGEGGGQTQSIIEDETIDPAKKATDLMLQTAYNLIDSGQYYFSARVDVWSGTSWAFSDYIYAQKGLDNFKKAFSYTGTGMNGFVLRSYYSDQKIELKGSSQYDFDKESWSYSPAIKNTSESTNRTEDDKVPYYYYGNLDFPLDFGGVKAKKVTEGRTEAIDYTLIDANSVKIEEKTDEKGKAYYVLSFNVLTSKLNASEEMKFRFSQTTADGKMENITFQSFTVKAEIWKDSGVFRSLFYNAKVNATLDKSTGNAEVEKTMNFRYDDSSCSVANNLKSEKPAYDLLSDANKAKCDAEVAALNKK